VSVVIPAKAGIQKPGWMPPDQVRGRLIKSGMTDNAPLLAAGWFIEISIL
jgi:hypothetical protein